MFWRSRKLEEHFTWDLVRKEWYCWEKIFLLVNRRYTQRQIIHQTSQSVSSIFCPVRGRQSSSTWSRFYWSLLPSIQLWEACHHIWHPQPMWSHFRLIKWLFAYIFCFVRWKGLQSGPWALLYQIIRVICLSDCKERSIGVRNNCKLHLQQFSCRIS